MNRCSLIRLIVPALLLVAVAPSLAQTTFHSTPMQLPMAQQGVRNFPPHAQFGHLRLLQTPAATLNEQSVRTAPGFRLFMPDNRLVFAHSMQNQNLQVAYIKEASTNWLLTAWILSPQEMARLTPKH